MMSEKETRFTSGTWHASRTFRTEGTRPGIDIGSSNGCNVALVHFDERDNEKAEVIANASLIAAAPQMFECLVNARALWGHRSTDAPQMKWLEEVDAALSKALGETP